MSKKNYSAQSKEKIALGRFICKLREEKGFSLRKFANIIGLSPSNMFYIENGINAPTAETYKKIIFILQPNDKAHMKLDRLYSTIRNMPPPDVCSILMRNPEIGEKIRMLENINLSFHQLKRIEELFIALKNQQP